MKTNDPVRVKREIERLALELAETVAQQQKADTELEETLKKIDSEKETWRKERESHLNVLGQLLTDRERVKQDILSLNSQKEKAMEEFAIAGRAVEGVAERARYLEELMEKTRENLHSSKSEVLGLHTEITSLKSRRNVFLEEVNQLGVEKVKAADELGKLNVILSKKQQTIDGLREKEMLIEKREQTIKAMLIRLDKEWLQHYKSLPHKGEL